MTTVGLSSLVWSEFVNSASQGRVLMWDVDGSEGWVDGRIQGYCRSIDNLPGKVTCAFGISHGASTGQCDA